MAWILRQKRDMETR